MDEQTRTLSARFDVSQRRDIDRLHNRAVGLAGVLFLTLTGAAPISAMLLNVPIVVGSGNGLGAPAAFLAAMLILLVFSVGYAAMAGKISSAGGFYAFISHGLGREAGMAMGFGAVIAYSIFEPATAGGFAYLLDAKLGELFGITIPWPVLAAGTVLLIALLTHFDVRVSSAVLGAALVCEVLILLVFDASVFAHAGHGSFVRLAALNPRAAFQGFPAHGKLAAGAAGIGLFFAFWSWIGFEMAPNYAEESPDPRRVVPLSLYISVLALGVLYTLTSWAGLSGFPDTDSALAAAQGDAAHFFFGTATKFLGPWASALMSLLMLSGSVACCMAFHNTASRYLYALGRERILPAMLGRTHRRHKTPHIASFAQTGITLATILLFARFAGGNDPATQAYGELYGLLVLLGTILILSAQAVVSLAIIVYFRRHHPQDHHWWKTLLAPLLAFAAHVYVIYLCISNMGFVGGGFAFANYIPWIDLAIICAGLGFALYLKQADPAKFEQAGRLTYRGAGPRA